MAESRITLPPVVRWRCPKGHEWTEDKNVTVTIAFWIGIREKAIDSGPLCPFCLCSYLRANFPAVQVEPAFTIGTAALPKGG